MAIPSAPATSPAMAAGRGSPNPMPAGLSALLKPDSTPRGMSSGNMQQVMSRAKSLSDRELADVLEGKSLVVPQYVAMTEAMGRRSLRTAMEGQQAMAQAKQPSVKDKLLMGDQPQMPQGMPQQPMMAAEGGLMYADGGIASLPAPNMDTVDMADGGIIAFNGGDNRQLVTEEDFQRLVTGKGLPLTKEQKEKLANTPNIFKDFGVSQRTIAARGAEPAPAPNARLSTAQDILNFTGEGTAPAPAVVAPPVTGVGVPPVTRVDGPAVAPAVVPGVSQTDSGMGSLKSYMDAIKANQEDYYKKVEGLGAKQREGLAQLRSQGGGEALMNIAQGLLSKAGLAQGISAGLPGVIQTASASRKEQRAVEGLANEYDMNLAKARSADAKGNTEAALKFMSLADQAKYQQGVLANQIEDTKLRKAVLNKDPEALSYLKAFAKPGEELSDTLARVEGIKSKTNLYSIDKATDDYNKIMENPVSSEAKRLKTAGITTPFAYQQYVLRQGGGGFDLSAQAKAELERRNK